jgi:hypothetical protein
LLSLIRAPHAFEHHHRHVELSWAMHPTLSALFQAPRFPQTLDPFTGRAGFTESYSPAILCLLDFVERLCGIMPRPDGTLWFTGLTPKQIEHSDAAHETAYSRIVDGRHFELVNTATESLAWRDGEPLFEAPRGVRVITSRGGDVLGLIGMSVTPIEGTLGTGDARYAFRVAPNEQFELRDGRFVRTRNPGLVTPTY